MCTSWQEKTSEVSSFLFLNLIKDSNFMLKIIWKIKYQTKNCFSYNKALFSLAMLVDMDSWAEGP